MSCADCVRGDLDLDQGLLEVKKTRISIGYKRVIESEPKTDSGFRWVAIDDATTIALRKHRLQQMELRLELGSWPGHDLVFTEANGDPVHPDRVSARFRRLVDTAELTSLSLHGLRHTKGTLGMASGENPEFVRQALGHSRIQVTLDMYSHADPELAKGSAERFAALIDG